MIRIRTVAAACLLLLLLPSPLPTDAAVSLAGSSWRPVALSGLAGTDDAPVFIAFSSADRVTGSGGCNRFFGSYVQKGGRLSIGPVAATKMACAPDVMDREQRFFAALARTGRFRVTARELTLMTLQDTVFLRLEPHG